MNNIYFILRHGEARSNKEQFLGSWPEEVNNPITGKGRKQIQKIIPKLKKENIDLIFSSDLLRCKQTAQMIVKELNLKVKFDKRLREIDFGILNNKAEKEWDDFFKTRKERFSKKPLNGENYRDIKKRTRKFIKDIDKRHKNKKILIISHGAILFSLVAIAKDFTEKQEIINRGKIVFKTGELRKL